MPGRRESIEIEQIIGANELALARAHITYPEVIELERRLPEWLVRLSTEAGVREFEATHGMEMPKALRQYYKSIRLISLLQAAWDVDVFLEDLDHDDLPGVNYWSGKPYVVIGYFRPSGTLCGAELLGEQQYMYWEGFSEGREPDTTLAQWICGAANRLLLGIP